MTVTVEIPDQYASQFTVSPAASARKLLEAYALREFAEGRIGSRHVGGLLGLSFHETEEFLHRNNAPPDLGLEEHLLSLKHLEEACAQ